MSRRLNPEGMFYKNRFTFISLFLAVGMFFIAESYYSPESAVRKGSAAIKGEGVPQIGGEFSVLTHEGKPFTQENLAGKYSLIFFGFTHCPDICPTSLTILAEVYEGLNERQQNSVQMIMASVDPERDTVEVLNEYVPAFNPRFIGLTGTLEQMKDMAKKYLVYNVKRPADEDGFYMVDHSGYIYFVGPDGRYVTHFSHKNTAEEILAGVKSYLRK